MGGIREDVEASRIMGILVAGEPDVSFFRDETDQQHNDSCDAQSEGGEHHEPVLEGVDYPDAAYANRALEAAGRPERIDHRSYEQQGVEKIPTIHMGVAASQMERRGIQTEKGNLNRQIAADNKLLKEIKARITRIYNWTKKQAKAEQP